MKIAATKSGLQICLVKEFVNEKAKRLKEKKRKGGINEKILATVC